MRLHYARGGGFEACVIAPLGEDAGSARGPFLPFPKTGMERREAPGVCETPLDGPCDRPVCALTAGPLLPGVAAFGVRGPSDVGPCASRRSTAMADASAKRIRKSGWEWSNSKRVSKSNTELGTPVNNL